MLRLRLSSYSFILFGSLIELAYVDVANDEIHILFSVHLGW